jgi:Ricin-type beta-trefoil lectin domain
MRLSTTLLRCAALVMLLSAAAPPALAAPQIKGAASNLCLGVEGGNTAPRTATQILECDGSAGRTWEATASGELRSFDGTRCLDVRGASTEARAVVQSYTCHGGANQKWTFKSDGSIASAASGLCLTVMGGRSSEGAGIDMWPCVGAAHQKWKQEDTGPPLSSDINLRVRGHGVDIRDVGTSGLAHIYPIPTRTDWEQERYMTPGKYHLFDARPAPISGKSYATTPIAKGYFGDDSRTDYSLDAFSADRAGLVTIAVPNGSLNAPGWQRVAGAFSTTIDTYYLYQYRYTSVGQWIAVPKTDASRPTLLFAEPGQLRFDNPLPIAPLAEGVVIAPARGYILPNGDYIASARGGPIGSGVFVRLWMSKDKGRSWSQLNMNNTALQHPVPFYHGNDGNLYLVGDIDGDGGIQRSTDGGKTWSGVAALGFAFRSAPSHVVTAKGRYWVQTEYSPGGASVISAPVNADLMNPQSWTRALTSGLERMGNEADVVATRNGGYPVVMPKGGHSKRVLSEREVTTDASRDVIDLPGNDSKYSVIYDAVSDRYWALTSYSNVPGSQRTGITLFSSQDLKTWKLEREVLKGLSNGFHGFNYPYMQIEGDDIVFVSRTAWEDAAGLAQRWHDANMLTFHRVRNFRTN